MHFHYQNAAEFRDGANMASNNNRLSKTIMIHGKRTQKVAKKHKTRPAKPARR